MASYAIRDRQYADGTRGIELCPVDSLAGIVMVFEDLANATEARQLLLAVLQFATKVVSRNEEPALKGLTPLR